MGLKDRQKLLLEDSDMAEHRGLMEMFSNNHDSQLGSTLDMDTYRPLSPLFGYTYNPPHGVFEQYPLGEHAKEVIISRPINNIWTHQYIHVFWHYNLCIIVYSFLSVCLEQMKHSICNVHCLPSAEFPSTQGELNLCLGTMEMESIPSNPPQGVAMENPLGEHAKEVIISRPITSIHSCVLASKFAYNCI